jgi:hypothetical protein
VIAVAFAKVDQNKNGKIDDGEASVAAWCLAMQLLGH